MSDRERGQADTWPKPMPTEDHYKVLDKRRAALTPTLIDKLVADASNSRLFDAQIAIRNNLHPGTLRLWLKLGLQEFATEPYKTFAERYAKAQIETEAEQVRLAIEGGQRTASGSIWWLERKYPKRWGNRQPESGPTDSVDIEGIINQATADSASLVELLRDPPPELLAAMSKAKPELLALLAAVGDQDEPKR